MRRKDNNNNNHNGNNDNKIEIRLERSNKFLVNCFWKKKERKRVRERENRQENGKEEATYAHDRVLYNRTNTTFTI